MESFKSETNCQEVPEDDAALRQKKNWTELAARFLRGRIMHSVDQLDRARHYRLLVHTLVLGHTLFSFNILGLHIALETVEIAVMLRFGAQIMEPHHY